MSSPKVSVCIPVFNGSRFIRTAIESVFNQSFQDFELIICDNRSTDNTLEIVRSYNDPRIKIYQNETNIGMAPNWNVVVGKAIGEYIKILPADDSMFPDCLKLQSQILDKDSSKKISLVCGRKNVINDSGKILFTRGFSRQTIGISGISAINKNVRSGGNIIGESGVVMFRREIFSKTNGFINTHHYVIDLSCWYQILLLGDLFSMSEVVGSFRVSHVSASTKIKDTQKNDLLAFNKEIYADKRFGLSYSSYVIGNISVYFLSWAKKILYRFILK